MMAGVLAMPLLGAGGDEAGFVPLFDGKTLNGWTLRDKSGAGYVVRDATIVCPADGGGYLMTERDYSNFVLRFEYLLTPGGNNGIGLRAPMSGNPSYEGMEIQILDDGHAQYKGKIRSEQHTGSIYDVFPARTGYQRPAGQWNEEEIIADGSHIRVTLNGVVIIDADLNLVREPDVLAHHPGLRRAGGRVGLLGHNTEVAFRNLRIKIMP